MCSIGNSEAVSRQLVPSPPEAPLAGAGAASEGLIFRAICDKKCVPDPEVGSRRRAWESFRTPRGLSARRRHGVARGPARRDPIPGTTGPAIREKGRRLKPLIAIIGRPNVGKSTLFNRLTDRKKAIVIDQPGATRDRNYADGHWRDRRFTVIDTGGFEPAADERILVQMREQTLLAIEEADILLFLMDGRTGLAPADLDIARTLRGLDKPVFFVVNKIDGARHEDLAYEFYRLGVEEIHPVSAQHGLGVAELLDRVIEHLPPAEAEAEDDPDEEPRRIAVIGRPNVGKSSLINRILGYERTIANPTPGTTRDPIDTPFRYNRRDYLFIDTAGIRRKSRISVTLEKYTIVQAMKAIDRSDITLLLVDAVEGVTEQDVKIAGLAVEKGSAVILCVNKWDLVDKDTATAGAFVADVRDKLKFLDFAPVVFISALTGQRVRRILEIIEGVYDQYTRRIPTAELNRQARDFIAAHPPPRYRNRDNAVSYLTQVGVKPPTFIFFVKEPKGMHFSYERYLTNQVRSAFGFDQVPVRIFFKRKS